MYSEIVLRLRHLEQTPKVNGVANDITSHFNRIPAHVDYVSALQNHRLNSIKLHFVQEWSR